MKKSHKKMHFSKILIYIFLSILAFIYLAPLVWMLFVSLYSTFYVINASSSYKKRCIIL